MTRVPIPGYIGRLGSVQGEMEEDGKSGQTSARPSLLLSSLLLGGEASNPKTMPLPCPYNHPVRLLSRSGLFFDQISQYLEVFLAVGRLFVLVSCLYATVYVGQKNPLGKSTHLANTYGGFDTC